MTGILKTLISKTRKQPLPEEAEALQRANQVLQFRVQMMAHNADHPKAA
jgi:hypothetical protein